MAAENRVGDFVTFIPKITISDFVAIAGISVWQNTLSPHNNET